MRNQIPEIRKRFNYSQQKLADELNVSRQTIISIEKGKYHPSLPLAMRIAKKFKLNVEDVFILDKEEE